MITRTTNVVINTRIKQLIITPVAYSKLEVAFCRCLLQYLMNGIDHGHAWLSKPTQNQFFQLRRGAALLQVLVESRAEAKKAVIVVTDGKSNIGPPPVRVARQLLALRWHDVDGGAGGARWDVDRYGPQVEIYAFSVADANNVELESIASQLPAHVFRLSTFRLFAEFARCLHGGSFRLFNFIFC